MAQKEGSWGGWRRQGRRVVMKGAEGRGKGVI